MVKITVRYTDGLVNSMVTDNITSIGAIVNEIVERCKEHGEEVPEFDFDDWENASGEP